MTQITQGKILVKLNADQKEVAKYEGYINDYKNIAAAVVALVVCWSAVSLIAGLLTYFALAYLLSILKIESAAEQK